MVRSFHRIGNDALITGAARANLVELVQRAIQILLELFVGQHGFARRTKSRIMAAGERRIRLRLLAPVGTPWRFVQIHIANRSTTALNLGSSPGRGESGRILCTRNERVNDAAPHAASWPASI